MWQQQTDFQWAEIRESSLINISIFPIVRFSSYWISPTQHLKRFSERVSWWRLTESSQSSLSRSVLRTASSSACSSSCVQRSSSRPPGAWPAERFWRRSCSSVYTGTSSPQSVFASAHASWIDRRRLDCSGDMRTVSLLHREHTDYSYRTLTTTWLTSQKTVHQVKVHGWLPQKFAKHINNIHAHIWSYSDLCCVVCVLTCVCPDVSL